ncbi:MAG: hypothetical protein JSV09_14485 [Thermoplasmata archaeon]|nr:MAG: hypothetical protein JSV09_14485 [Thermoplasmata archaeon]
MTYEINKIEFSDEFKVCPVCGYEDGYHSMFIREGDEIRWYFICPECHKIFDIGFSVP